MNPPDDWLHQAGFSFFEERRDLNLSTPPEHQSLTSQDSQGDSQTAVNSSDGLSQVVTVWPRLSPPLKAAILAIIVTASK
jgi:hypothetical protein